MSSQTSSAATSNRQASSDRCIDGKPRGWVLDLLLGCLINVLLVVRHDAFSNGLNNYRNVEACMAWLVSSNPLKSTKGFCDTWYPMVRWFLCRKNSGAKKSCLSQCIDLPCETSSLHSQADVNLDMHCSSSKQLNRIKPWNVMLSPYLTVVTTDSLDIHSATT